MLDLIVRLPGGEISVTRLTACDVAQSTVLLRGFKGQVFAFNQPENAAFVDGVHYKRKAGIEIVSCLVAPCISPLRPTRLDPQSIGLYLEQIDALRVQYVMEHPAATAKLRKWLGLEPRSVK